MARETVVKITDDFTTKTVEATDVPEPVKIAVDGKEFGPFDLSAETVTALVEYLSTVGNKDKSGKPVASADDLNNARRNLGDKFWHARNVAPKASGNKGKAATTKYFVENHPAGIAAAAAHRATAGNAGWQPTSARPPAPVKVAFDALTDDERNDLAAKANAVKA
jgi:hypothetical protein